MPLETTIDPFAVDCLAINNQNVTCMPSTSQSSDQDAKCCLSKIGCAQKAKFWILTFTFSPPLFFCFSCRIFLFFCWAFTRVSLWWKKVLGKAFRWEEVQVVRGKDFHWSFKVKHCISLRSPWLNPAHPGMVWKISSPCNNLFQRQTTIVDLKQCSLYCRLLWPFHMVEQTYP